MVKRTIKVNKKANASAKFVKSGKLTRLVTKKPGLKSVRVRNLSQDLMNSASLLQTTTKLNQQQINSTLMSIQEVLGDITSIATNVSIPSTGGYGFSQCDTNICNGEKNGDCAGGHTGGGNCDTESSCETHACGTHTCTGAHTCDTHDCTSNACSNNAGFVDFTTSVWASQAWADIVTNIAATNPNMETLTKQLSIQMTPNLRLGQ